MKVMPAYMYNMLYSQLKLLDAKMLHGPRGNVSTVCAHGTLTENNKGRRGKFYTGDTTCVCVCGRAEETTAHMVQNS